MAVKIDGSAAKVIWLSTPHGDDKLTAEHSLLYLAGIEDNKIKFGQRDSKDLTGMTPVSAFENRYASQSSNQFEDLIASHIFVFEKSMIPENVVDVDDAIRVLINDLYKKGEIEFDALHPNNQLSGYNSEALVGFKNAFHSEDLINIVKQFFRLKKTFNTHKPVIPREYQISVIDQVVFNLSNYQTCLLAAYPSFGKTLTSLEIIAKMFKSGGLVLFSTPIVDTLKSLIDNLNSYQFGDNRDLIISYMDSTVFAKSSIERIKERVADGEIIVLLLSVQDMRYQDENSEVDAIREKYTDLSGNLDLWICDERHFQYEGAFTSKKLSGLSARYNLDLTATAYELYDKYDPEQIIIRGLPWALANRGITKMPGMLFQALNTPMCNADPKFQEIYELAEGFSPSKLFATNNNNFVHRTELELLAYNFYANPCSKGKNPLSITNDTSFSDVAKNCGMWLLPLGSAKFPASSYIPALAKMLNTAQDHTFFISSYEISEQCPSFTTIGDFVEQLLSDHNRVIILTCRKFTTGTDIPALGHIIMFDKMDKLSNFEQLLGRLIRIYKDKDSVKLFSLVPGQSLTVALGNIAKYNELSNGVSCSTTLDNMPLSAYDCNGSLVDVSVNEILDITNQFSLSQVRNGKLSDTALSNILQKIDTDSWQYLDLINNKSVKKLKLDVSDLNGSKQSIAGDQIPGTPTNCDEIKKLNNHIMLLAQIKETIQSVILESRWVSYSLDCYDFREVFANQDLIYIFGQDVMDKIIDLADNMKTFRDMLTQDFNNKRIAYSTLSDRQIYPLIFDNTEFKQKNGLVYMDFALAEQLADEIHLVNPFGTIGVINSLNGTLPIVLRERNPFARIICLETFDHHKNYLRSLGFEVMDVNIIKQDAIMPNITVDVFVGNPPYQDGSIKSGQNKIYNQLCKRGLELLSEAGIAIIVSPTSVLKFSKRFSLTEHQLKLVNFNAQQFFSIGVSICYWVVDKTYHGDVTVIYDDKVEVYPRGKPIHDPRNNNTDFIDLYYALKTVTDTPTSRMFRQNNFGTSAKNIKDDIYKYDVYKLVKGTTVVTRYSKRPPYFFNKLKISMSMTTTLSEDSIRVSTIDYDVGYMCYEVANVEEANNVKSFIFSDYFIDHANKWRAVDGYGFNNALKHLPPFDSTKPWTNDEVREFLEGFIQ